MTNEEIMQFKEIIKELINETTAEIMKDTKELINEVKEMNKIYREEIKQLKEENLKIKQEMKELRVKMIKIEEIEERLEVADRKDRKNNIIISGLEIPNATEKEMEDNVKHFFENQLKIKISVPKIKEIKEKTYLIKVENFAQKLEIMKNKAKLPRGKYNQVYINNDLTQNERKIQQKLKEIAKQKIEERKTVKIGYQKLIINGQKWTWNTKSSELERDNANTKNWTN